MSVDNSLPPVKIPKLQARWYEAHSLGGVLILIPLFIILVTGTISFFLHELRPWHTPALWVDSTPLPAAINPLLSDLIDTMPRDAAALWVHLPSEDAPIFEAHWPKEVKGEYATLGLNPVDGSLISESALSSQLAEHIYHWHYLDPLPLGLEMSGMIALLWFALTISGIYIHRKKLLSQFKGWRGKSGRALQSWIHTAVGTLTLPLHLIYGVTGAFLGLNVLALSLVVVLAFDGDQKAALQTLFGSEEPAAFTDVQVAALPNLDPFLERTRAEIPEGRIDNFYIERPYDEGALMHIHVETDAGEAEVKYEIHRSLEPVVVVQAGDVPSGLKILFASLNLHFGNFGGIVVKLIYTLCGIGLCLLTYAGTRLWIYRVGRGKPRAAQCLDRLFDGIGLGLLPALAIFAWANRLIPSDVMGRGAYEILAFHIAWALIAGLVLILGTGPARRRQLLIATLALLAMVPIFDGCLYGAWPWSSLSWRVPSVAWINLTFWAIPAFCWLGVRLRRPDSQEMNVN